MCIRDSPEHLQETAVIYNNLTKLYHMTGDKTQARFCLTRALQALGKCPEAERTHCAEILNSLAGYLYAEGDCETAAALYLSLIHILPSPPRDKSSSKISRSILSRTNSFAM